MPVEIVSFDTVTAGTRLDRFIGGNLENASLTRIQKWIEEGKVLVNGKAVRKSHVLEEGEVIQVEVPDEE